MLAIAQIPFKILGFLIKHPRMIILLVIGIFGIFAFTTCSNVFGGKSSATAPKATPNYQLNAPAIKDAPYMLLTDTRIYYISKYDKTSDGINLISFYEYTKTAWIKNTHSLPITKASYKGAKLYDRQTNKAILSF